MRFQKATCKVLRLGWGDPHYQDGLRDGWMESSPAEKDLETLVGEELDMSQHCALGASQQRGQQPGEGVPPLCSALVRPPWSPGSPVPASHGAAGAGPEAAMGTMGGLEPLCCGDGLGELGWLSLGEGGLRETLLWPSDTLRGLITCRFF